MHYANGRIAKNGDKVILLPNYGSPLLGILYDAQAGNNDCNGKLAPCSPSDPMPDLKSCIHYDDVVHLFAGKAIPDASSATVSTLKEAEPSQYDNDAVEAAFAKVEACREFMGELLKGRGVNIKEGDRLYAILNDPEWRPTIEVPPPNRPKPIAS